jgi:hypothetical protein
MGGLPLELWNIIVEFDPEVATLLTLTCKELYELRKERLPKKYENFFKGIDTRLIKYKSDIVLKYGVEDILISTNKGNATLINHGVIILGKKIYYPTLNFNMDIAITGENIPCFYGKLCYFVDIHIISIGYNLTIKIDKNGIMQTHVFILPNLVDALKKGDTSFIIKFEYTDIMILLLTDYAHVLLDTMKYVWKNLKNLNLV